MFADRDLVTSLEENFTVIGPVTLGIDNEKDPASLAKTLYHHYMSDVKFDEAHGDQLTQVRISWVATLLVLLENISVSLLRSMTSVTNDCNFVFLRPLVTTNEQLLYGLFWGNSSIFSITHHLFIT